MSAVRGLFALLVLIGLVGTANAAEVPIPPAPAHWATDTAGFLAPQTVVALDARLRAYESSSGHQVLVYVAPTTGATPMEDWTVRAFARWKVGRKSLDDGLVLFVFPKDRKLRIEVGYGLEQTMLDATAARIIRDITPELKAGRADAAVTSGVDEILAVLSGEPRPTRDSSAAGKNVDAPDPSSVQIPVPVYDNGGTSRFDEIFGTVIGILIGLLVVAGIIALIMKLPDPPKGAYISSRGSGFGFLDALNLIGGIASVAGSFSGGGGGGFSGGGGSSGGGGASGSW